MDVEHSLPTSATLLLRLRNNDDGRAWSTFVDRYAPRILSWCRSKGASQQDAEEITQLVLVKLIERMKTFEYNEAKGRFRAWLRTVTVNTWKDFLRDNARFRNVAASFEPDEFAETVEEEFDRELFEAAQEVVRKKVDPKTWQVFQSRVFEDRPGREVAEQTGMTVAAVNMAVSRVKKLLTAEVESIEKRETLKPT